MFHEFICSIYSRKLQILLSKKLLSFYHHTNILCYYRNILFLSLLYYYQLSKRRRFLNIVNPFLEQVQSQSGLNAFRVIMDDSNNTPDVVDRNQLYGQIFVQPTRTAEFIVLDFTIQPTGATFPE